MLENGTKNCPVCKEAWIVIPAINIEYRYIHQQLHFFNLHLIFYLPYRDKIERLHSKEVNERRKQYTKKDEDIIKRLLSSKEKTSKMQSSGIHKTMDEVSKGEKSQKGI